jgi:hypothetical protein
MIKMKLNEINFTICYISINENKNIQADDTESLFNRIGLSDMDYEDALFIYIYVLNDEELDYENCKNMYSDFEKSEYFNAEKSYYDCIVDFFNNLK